MPNNKELNLEEHKGENGQQKNALDDAPLMQKIVEKEKVEIKVENVENVEKLPPVDLSNIDLEVNEGKEEVEELIIDNSKKETEDTEEAGTEEKNKIKGIGFSAKTIINLLNVVVPEITYLPVKVKENSFDREKMLDKEQKEAIKKRLQESNVSAKKEIQKTVSDFTPKLEDSLVETFKKYDLELQPEFALAMLIITMVGMMFMTGRRLRKENDRVIYEIRNIIHNKEREAQNNQKSEAKNDSETSNSN